jgi:Lipocalin-like domain
MKNLFYVTALISLLLMGCDKEDTTDVSKVVGNWELTEIYTDDGVSTNTGFGETFSYTYSFYGKDFNTVTTFTENPNTFTSSGSYTVVTTAVIGGLENTVETNVPAFNTPGQWEINGDTFIQTISGNSTEFQILELSDTKLRLRFDEDVTFESGGYVTNNQATVFSTFERQ